jgi:transglutaminase-like putative cysteine protease
MLIEKTMSMPSPSSSLWQTTNRLRYAYSAPVTRVTTRLRLLPRHRHGAQQTVETRLWIDPWPRTARSWVDRFGNHNIEIEHFELKSYLEICAEAYVTMFAGERAEDALDPEIFLSRTRLVDRNEELDMVAMHLRRCCRADEALAWECMEYVHNEMQYRSGVTGVMTTASAAFTQRAGVCQDFSQVMLAILRAAGLPARYVSGHMEGEGQMHAWIEALYATGASSQPEWHALDPTHNRAAQDGYVTIAVGRDYSDISPVSGRCFGPEPGALTTEQETRRCEVSTIGSTG